MKRFIIAATAAFTILTAVALDAGPANAHHSIIVGVAGCADPQGTYSVKWTVTADAVRGLTWTIDGVTKPDSAAFTYTTVHNLSGPAPSLTKTATWSNGITSTVTGTTGKPGYCPVVTTTTAPATTTTIAPTTTTEAPSTTTTTAPAPTTTSSDSPPTSPSTIAPATTASTSDVDATTSSTVAVGLPPLPPTTEGDATSQAPGPPPVPPSGLPKTGLKRDTARLALGLLIVGLVLVGVRRVRRT